MKHPISTSLTILAVGFLVWIAFFAPGFQWTGAVMKTFTVRVTQGAAGAPIHGETVLFLRSRTEAERLAGLGELERSDWLDALTSHQMAGVTSADGTVSLRGQFGAGGTSSLLRERGSYRAAGILVLLRKDGSSVSRELECLVGLEKRSLRQELPLVEMALD